MKKNHAFFKNSGKEIDIGCQVLAKIHQKVTKVIKVRENLKKYTAKPNLKIERCKKSKNQKITKTRSYKVEKKKAQLLDT